MSSKKMNLNINVSKDDSQINDFLEIWRIFDARPNKVTIHKEYKDDILTQFEEFESINKFSEVLSHFLGDILNEKVLRKVSETIYISYVVVDKLSENCYVSDLIIYYKSQDDLDKVDELLKETTNFQDCEVEEQESNNLYSVGFDTSGLYLDTLDLKSLYLENTEELYSKKTWKDINKFAKKIKKKTTGLSIFYGDRGTGKSSIIKYLSEQLENDFIFISNSVLDVTINSSEFRKFLEKYNNPVIILDDCEMIFNEFFTKSNMISNNLIQLVDGLIRMQNLNIITIFNFEDKSEIDHNLTECNNLLDIIEFTYLTKDESNQLSESLKYKSKNKEEKRLIDVLNNKKPDKTNRLGF